LPRRERVSSQAEVHEHHHDRGDRQQEQGCLQARGVAAGDADDLELTATGASRM
jgi:hypothetical protein